MRVIVPVRRELARLDLGEDLAGGDRVPLLDVQRCDAAADLWRHHDVVGGDDTGEDEDRGPRLGGVVPAARAEQRGDEDEAEGRAHGETLV